jgi:Flp pilus assembly protein TadD
VGLGAAFPLALSIVGAGSHDAAGRFGIVYAVNTLGAVLGSLAAGFVFIPLFGLQPTLRVVSGCLIAAALLVVVWGALSTAARTAGLVAAAAAAVLIVVSPPWDRELLASGVYMYAPYVPKDLDLETLLKAGTLLYYREGAASTVSVKRLTGTTMLAVDGKTDASNRGDMLTQKLVAHLPLLLHENPREIGIIGLGSGVTAGSALRHPITRADVIEISPEVVEASRYFEAENHHALSDPRTNLIVGDGRSHLLLTARKYDVIISEPSNPWIAGVAALFTREFFAAAKERLSPGGIICQWANAYNISDHDLRAIVATFRSVFPNGTAWLVGADDVLLAASTASLEPRLGNIERHWSRPGVAGDLKDVSALEPFSIWSLYVGGPDELARYSEGAAILTDDRMTLEFSGPRELHSRSAGENGATLAALLGHGGGPAIVKQAKASAGAAQWRNRAAMMAKRDAHATAYDDYVRALTLDPTDGAALDGLVRTAVLTSRGSDALSWVKSLNANRTATPAVLIAASKLLAAIGSRSDAIEAARQASRVQPVHPEALEQLASLSADAGDTAELDLTVQSMRTIAPHRAATYYYAAAAEFLHGKPEQAVELAMRAVAIDSTYAPVYDLIGAAYTKLGQASKAREAFETSLRFDAHDSTAYTNLGLLELAAGNRAAAVGYFAEALWLAPESQIAREGLARARQRS